jgi:NDP-sugar pyrophosphorylase family protein
VTTRITKAFVLGAGLGTRLRPLTETIPKPLIPIFGKPLITFALDHLITTGIRSFVINTHRLKDQFATLFATGEYGGAPVRLTHEPELLETGGGIKNAEDFLNDGPFITYSGDILCDVRLEPLIEEHFRNRNDVTLGLRNTGLASGVALRDGRIVDIANKLGTPGTHDYANIAVWNPGVFKRMEPLRKISFIPILVDWISANGRIGGVVLDDGKWFNVGSAADYIGVHRTILQSGWRPPHVTDRTWPQPVHVTARISETAKLTGCCVIGPNSRVGAGAVLEDTILWEDAEIASRSHLSRCIVRARQTAAGEHQDHVF